MSEAGGSGERQPAHDESAWLPRQQALLLARIRSMMGPEVREALESGDVLQGVVAQALERFRGGGGGDTEGDTEHVLGWMTTAARHAIVDEARRAHERPLQPLAREPSAGGESSVGSALAGREDENELERALAELDPERRRALEMRAQEGASWQVVALALGRSEEAARKLYNRALLQLGQRLERGRPG